MLSYPPLQFYTLQTHPAADSRHEQSHHRPENSHGSRGRTGPARVRLSAAHAHYNHRARAQHVLRVRRAARERDRHDAADRARADGGGI